VKPASESLQTHIRRILFASRALRPMLHRREHIALGRFLFASLSNHSARLIRLSHASSLSTSSPRWNFVFEIGTLSNTATPLRRQVAVVQVSCEEKTARKV
jgi:hypothetical protein